MTPEPDEAGPPDDAAEKHAAEDPAAEDAAAEDPAAEKHAAEHAAAEDRAADDGLVRIHDPRAIRALAHPARLAVLDALRDERTLTATEAAEIAGLSPSAMSYHLRALAKWGIILAVDPNAGGDGRERRWRQAGRGLVMETSAAGAEAAGAMIATRYLDRDRDEVVQFLHRGTRESPFWRENATIGHSEGWMTDAEAMEIHDLIEQIQLAHRRHQGEAQPPGTRRVRTTFVMIPIDDPEAGNDGGGAS